MAIRERDALARIADLSSYKVQGNISDNYLDQLLNSVAVISPINETLVRTLLQMGGILYKMAGYHSIFN